MTGKMVVRSCEDEVAKHYFFNEEEDYGLRYRQVSESHFDSANFERIINC